MRDGACKMPQLLGANCPQNIENVIPETQIRMSQDFFAKLGKLDVHGLSIHSDSITHPAHQK